MYIRPAEIGSSYLKPTSSPLMQLLMPLAIVLPSKRPSTLRACKRSHSLMTCNMVCSVEIAREVLSADVARPLPNNRLFEGRLELVR
jgi:hypothetical protein